jgi:medium-chain acyl-[acyl-carrier-protein] hydrolase
MRTPWLVNLKPNQSAGVRLFCFPYAGGGDSTFRSWQQILPDTIEVCPVQLPGRGARIIEPPCTEINKLIRLAGEALAPHLDKPFAFFGHSMGALIGFELAYHLLREYNAQPIHLFVSGRCSPQTMSKPVDPELDSTLQEMLRSNNGTPDEALENPELMELVLPVLRADMALCRSHDYTPQPPFDFPITAFGGLDDHGVPRHAIEGWREHTTGPFALRMLPGDHFFLNRSSRLPLLEAISKELEQDMKEKGMGHSNAS